MSSYRVNVDDVVAPGPDDVEINPTELVFHRPLKKRMQQLMYIKNNNTDPNLMLAFKVKTTKQDGYTVQKPSGDILSGEQRLITVTLQDLTGSDKPDKFLLQFVLIPRVEPAASSGATHEPADTVFKQWADETLKRKIYQKKLFVWFLAEGTSRPSNAPLESTPLRNSIAADSNLSPDTPSRTQHSDSAFLSPNNATSSSSPQYQQMSQEQGINKSVQDTRPAHVDNFGSDIPSSSSGAFTTGSSIQQPKQTVLETVKNIATAPSMEELKMQLAEARAQIAGMSQEGGLRMRKAANAVGVEDVIPATQAAMNTARSEGVPVQWTALLCLLSFLIAYFFF